MRLEPGGHPSSSEVCLVELISLLMGLPKTASPKCVSDVVATAARRVNDALDDIERQRLAILIPRIMRCRSEGGERGERWRVWQRVALWAARSVEHLVDDKVRDRWRRAIEASERALWDNDVELDGNHWEPGWTTACHAATLAGRWPGLALEAAMTATRDHGEDLVLWLDDLIDAWHKAMIEEGCDPEDPTIDYPPDEEVNAVIEAILASCA